MHIYIYIYILVGKNMCWGNISYFLEKTNLNSCNLLVSEISMFIDFKTGVCVCNCKYFTETVFKLLTRMDTCYPSFLFYFYSLGEVVGGGRRRKNRRKRKILATKIHHSFRYGVLKIGHVKGWLVGWLVGWVFYGISTFVGYLMPNPFLCKISVLVQTIQFSLSTQFNCQKHFYFKLFSLFKQF